MTEPELPRTGDSSVLGRRAVAGGLAVVGLLWALVQGVYTYAVFDVGEVSSYECTLDQPTLYYAALTVGALSSALAALGLVLSNRHRYAMAAIAIEAVFALSWFAVGGWRAAGCALGV
jgi:hypothetical protein